jgi:transcription antitermination factor NusG
MGLTWRSSICNINMNEKKANWYAIYTKPRCEKKVYEILEQKGIEAYCPLQKIQKKWSDRYKIIEEPLFKSYIFIKSNSIEKIEIKMLQGVVNFVYWLGKPAIVAENDIITIKKFLKEYKNVTVEQIEIKHLQEVKVTSGILMDQVGIIKKIYKNKVIVELQSIGFKLMAELRKEDIMVI